jgi:hypothetical protein
MNRKFINGLILKLSVLLVFCLFLSQGKCGGVVSALQCGVPSARSISIATSARYSPTNAGDVTVLTHFQLDQRVSLRWLLLAALIIVLRIVVSHRLRERR